MALRWIDSFDALGNTALPSKYDPAATAGVVTCDVPGRTGANHLGVNTLSVVVSKILPISGTTGIVGVAIRVPSGSLGSGAISVPYLITLQEAGIKHMAVGLAYSGFGSQFNFTVYRGSTVLATTTALYSADTWWYLEFKATIHPSAGSYELRVDTVPVLSASGLNTSNGGTNIWNRFGLWGAFAGSVYNWFDDLYVCDGSGSTRNDFLGVVRVEASLMVPAAAAHQEWTPSTGTDHGSMVDETIPDGDTTYNAASGPAKDSYQHTALTLTGAIQGVQVNPSWRKTDAGACTARTLARVAGTTYGGSTQNPLTTYSVMPEVLEVNPNSGVDWTAAIFNAAEFGVERLT